MAILNIEFKATTSKITTLEMILQKSDPLFIGEDHQVDTYFKVNSGRLKLREGAIENALIQYDRPNTRGNKVSNVLLYPCKPGNELKEMLINSLGVLAIVDKIRRIYFVENVKIHFDVVKGLGTFVEVEAIDKDGTIGKEKLQEQCNHFASLFGISQADFVAGSYAEMIPQLTE